MASTTALLLLLGVLCVGFASAVTVSGCCLTVAKKPLPLRHIESYTIQEAGKGCPISAIVFITKRGRILCFPYPNDKLWLRTYIKYLDEKRPRPQ